MALQIPRALAASALALLVDFAILELCLRGLGMAAMPSTVVGYLSGGVVQYVLCSAWVFSTALDNNAIGFVTFTLLSLVGLGITWVVVRVVHDWMGLPVEVAKSGAVALAFTWNFLSRRFLLFRTPRHAA